MGKRTLVNAASHSVAVSKVCKSWNSNALCNVVNADVLEVTNKKKSKSYEAQFLF